MAPITGYCSGSLASVAPPYVGPGDVVAGGTAWWGLRAFSNADIGTNAIRLRRSSDNAEQDFATIAGGALDIASITTFKGGSANLFCVTLYDQIGSLNLTQATAGSQPLFILSGLGSNPVLRPTFAGIEFLATSGSITTTAQPYTTTWAAMRTSDFASQHDIFGCGAIEAGYKGADLAWQFVSGGSDHTTAATDNAFHGICSVFNGASSDVHVDTTTGTGTVAAGNIGGTVQLFGKFGGDWLEGGIWRSTGFNATQGSNTNNNAKTFWGY